MLHDFFSYSSHVPMMVERPWFQWQSRQHPHKRIQWKPDHLTTHKLKNVGLCRRQKAHEGPICIDGFVFRAIKIQSCCTLSGEDKRFCSANHFGRTRRSAKTQQKSDNMLWTLHLKKFWKLVCSEHLWKCLYNSEVNESSDGETDHAMHSRQRMILFCFIQNMCLAACWT